MMLKLEDAPSAVINSWMVQPQRQLRVLRIMLTSFGAWSVNQVAALVT